MSTRDLIALATQTASKLETVAPSLLKIALDLIKQLLSVCDQNKISLEHVPAFSLRNNEWNAALIQIFRVFYEEELDQAIDAGKVNAPIANSLFVKPTDSAESHSISNILYNYLNALHDRRNMIKPFPNTEEYRSVKGAPTPTISRSREIKDKDLNFIDDNLKLSITTVNQKFFGYKKEISRKPSIEINHTLPEINPTELKFSTIRGLDNTDDEEIK